MFAGRAYREGFDQGSRHGRSDHPKQPWPSFWKGFLSKTYVDEFVRGYHAGYALGCKGQEIERQREQGRSDRERLAALRRNRSPEQEQEDERSR